MTRDDWDEDYDPRDADHIEGKCKVCGDFVVSVTIDEGIGSYEFWGARGVHHDYVEASPCCHAEVVECSADELEEV